jgi:hypothetical protein
MLNWAGLRTFYWSSTWHASCQWASNLMSEPESVVSLTGQSLFTWELCVPWGVSLCKKLLKVNPTTSKKAKMTQCRIILHTSPHAMCLQISYLHIRTSFCTSANVMPHLDRPMSVPCKRVCTPLKLLSDMGRQHVDTQPSTSTYISMIIFLHHTNVYTYLPTNAHTKGADW